MTTVSVHQCPQAFTGNAGNVYGAGCGFKANFKSIPAALPKKTLSKRWTQLCFKFNMAFDGLTSNLIQMKKNKIVK